MEAMLSIGRTQMGFVFGLATVTLTVGMNVARACTAAWPADGHLFASGAFSAISSA